MHAAPRDYAVSIPDTGATVPSSWRSTVRHDPSRNVRAARVSASERSPYATFRIAPVGSTPVVAYRQSAMSNFRASATIPIRRARLPVPNLA
jgi:hypothetical protein